MNDGGMPNQRPLEVGDSCYFEGVHYYQERHGNFGNGWGASVIYIGKNEKGEQLYIGFDFDTAVTEDQINQALIDLYLMPPRINVTEEILKRFRRLRI
ncbi:MAG: hypothetical protein HWD61_08340 [Parachlamydiaceae bacterium]|nr:MAG: hypothetical protein HWD61_08340 [Parachlamydiaceae bacterium]